MTFTKNEETMVNHISPVILKCVLDCNKATNIDKMVLYAFGTHVVNELMKHRKIMLRRDDEMS